MERLRSFPRALALAVVVLAAAACGDDNSGAADAAVGNDLALCHPDVRTCTTEQCGLPCDPTRDTPCTDHGCFEPYGCVCNGSTWQCHDGIPLCGDDMARVADLASAD